MYTQNREPSRPVSVRFLIFGTLCAFTIIGIRLAHLQINLNAYCTDQGERNFTRTQTVQAPRGTIYDCNGIPLATNRPITNVYWIGSGKRTFSAEQQRILHNVIRITNQSPDDTDLLTGIAQAERSYHAYPIARDLSFAQLSALSELCAQSANVQIQTTFQRHYPYHHITCHVVGYLGRCPNKQFVGKAGIEQFLENDLRGQDGTVTQTINSLGYVLSMQESIREQPGKDVYTTLDIHLQTIAQEAFPLQRRGAIIIMDPENGALKAVVSSPAFDPHLFLKPIASHTWQKLQDGAPFIDRALQASYPPGSIFKLITMSAALECNFLNPRSYCYCSGYTVLNGHTYWCHRRTGHGILSLVQSVAKSCNAPFFEIGRRLDINTLASFARAFGLGSHTGIALSEKTGLVPDRTWKEQTYGQPWWPGETLSVSIGQSFLLTTPLQIARMIGGIFTGYLVTPRILHGEPIISTPLPLQQTTLSFLRDAMYTAIQSGTARRIGDIPHMYIWGKTSTAQTSATHKRTLGSLYLEHGWFVCSFKHQHEKPLVAVVLVENAGSGQVATTIARSLLLAYKRHIEAKMP